jgi:hypothetical protein
MKKSDPRWLPIGELSAFVSELVFEPGQRARWAYREAPDDEEDSGSNQCWVEVHDWKPD